MEEHLDQRFWVGRNGDNLMGSLFECGLCHFRNMAERDHIPGNTRDNLTLLCIWIINLDTMMNMETSTVLDNFQRLQGNYQDSTPSFCIKRPIPVIRTNKVKDRVGMRVALIALNTSLHADKYTDNIQWDMMRKTPTWYINVVHQRVWGRWGISCRGNILKQ